MPLEAPKLDTQTFEEIYQSALLRIPRYVPEWTDYNESDPGIALTQLFAWLTEMTIFKLNQVPERNYVKFLQLLKMERRAAKPAIAHVTFVAQPDFANVPVVPQYTRLEGQPLADNEPLLFETETGLDLIRLPLVKVVVYDGAEFRDFTDANTVKDVTFRPLGWTPQVGNALYLGFAQPKTALRSPIFPQQMRLRVFLRERPLLNRAQNCAEAQSPPAPPVTLIWEYRPNAEGTRWKPLNTTLDETAAFTREGYILVAGPTDITPTTEPASPDASYYWLRCRLGKGTYPIGHEPEIDMIRPNVVAAKNLTTVRDELVSTTEGEFESSGRPNQVFVLQHWPVASQSLQLEVVVNGEPTKPPWREVEDLLVATTTDHCYTFNLSKGEIQFGDGVNGLIPVAGAEIIARSYRYGGGERGNVPSDHINDLSRTVDGVERVTNERASVGGCNEQSDEEFKKHAPYELRSRRRAITNEDFAALALQAGGIAKAKAIALRHPDFTEAVKVPGTVTVVIVPDNRDRPPIPSSEEISNVCRHLNQFRLITTEVYVKGPTYTAIRVEATVSAKPYAAFNLVSQTVAQRINDYLNPLRRQTDRSSSNPPNAADPAAAGSQPLDLWPEWDFGNELHPTNLFAVITQVRDVVTVKNLALFVDGVPHEDLKKPVEIAKDGLIYGVEEHEIIVIPDEDR